MVHHEWGQRGSRNVRGALAVARPCLGEPPRRYVPPRAGEHHGPRSILIRPRVASVGPEVLMLERQGRGVTRPLH